LIKRWSAGYSDPCSTRSTSSELRSIALMISCPWAGPKRRIRRISTSSVPCSSSTRGSPLLVDILGEPTRTHLGCQGESLFAAGGDHLDRGDLQLRGRGRIAGGRLRVDRAGDL